MRKLQALCTVKSHQYHMIIALIQAVYVRHQCNLFQESAKRRRLIHLFARFFIRYDLTHQFINILDPRLCLFIAF